MRFWWRSGGSSQTQNMSEVMGKRMILFKRLYFLMALAAAVFLAISLF